MYRRIFVILVRDSAILNGMTTSSYGEVAVRELVEQIHILCTTPEPDSSEDAESAEENAQPTVLTDGAPIAETDSLFLYDWYLNELPPDLRLEELPKPGIVLAIVSSESEGLDSDDRRSLSIQVRLYAEKANENIGARIRNFMVSPDAVFEPIPLKRFDVFLSHDTRDRLDALIVQDALKARGLSCFVASENLPIGSPWKEELLHGIRNARVGIVLLTERAIASQWVLCEVGALWGAGIPIVPVLKNIQFAQLPETISSFQWYTTSDWNDLESFCQRVYELCRNPPKR